MQGDHLGAEEIVAVGDTRGDVDVVQAAVGDYGGGGPLAVGVAGFLDLEPTGANSGVCEGVGDLFEVG